MRIIWTCSMHKLQFYNTWESLSFAPKFLFLFLVRQGMAKGNIKVSIVLY